MGYKDSMEKASIFKELFWLIKHRKRYWLAPIIIILLLLGFIIILTQGSALAPFIYTLF
jgi:hypothetical protein